MLRQHVHWIHGYNTVQASGVHVLLYYNYIHALLIMGMEHFIRVRVATVVLSVDVIPTL